CVKLSGSSIVNVIVRRLRLSRSNQGRCAAIVTQSSDDHTLSPNKRGESLGDYSRLELPGHLRGRSGKVVCQTPWNNLALFNPEFYQVFPAWQTTIECISELRVELSTLAGTGFRVDC